MLYIASYWPGALTQAIRNFAKSLESWLTNAMMNIPEEMVRIKVLSVFRYSCWISIIFNVAIFEPVVFDNSQCVTKKYIIYIFAFNWHFNQNDLQRLEVPSGIGMLTATLWNHMIQTHVNAYDGIIQ